MYFSEYFGIERSDADDWFDPLLETDTPVFVDPFLIFKEEFGLWSNSHQEIVKYFQRAFELLAPHFENPLSLQYLRVLTLMEFPEPVEFGLGYVSVGTQGAGTGKDFARRIVKSMCEAIRRGLENLVHFEELGVLVDQINRDRISDIACNILKPQFILYTQQIAERHGLTLDSVRVPRSVFDSTRQRWVDAEFRLPRNPITSRAVLLTPSRFLDELPKLNSSDWFRFADSQLRDDVNLSLVSQLRKEDIITLARQNPELVREWTTARESDPATPYDIQRDPVGLHNWQSKTRPLARRFPLDIDQVRTTSDLENFIRLIVGRAKHMIEEQGLWPLLYNDDTGRPKRELAVQLAFKGIVQSYCEAYGVRVDREVELGKGPVDFVLASSPTVRTLLEIKKMSNSDYWNGLERQLTSYLSSDQCQWGWFLAVRFNDRPSQVTRTRELAQRTVSASKETGFNLTSAWIDARPKDSASKLRDGTDGARTEPVVVDDEFPDSDGD